MQCLRLAVIFSMGTLAAPAIAAEQHWLKLSSSNFELYTTAGERKGREAILYFEQVRDFFSKALPHAHSSSPAKVRIIAFRSEKEYAPFRPNGFATAFYQAGFDRDYICMQSIAEENYPVAVHEFTHLLVRRSGFDPPVWFNEGLAELYSTLKPVGKKVKVGDLIPGRVIVLRQHKWLPLETLLAVDHNSPHYNERNRAGVFYAESWALMHMLSLSEPYRHQLPKFVTLLAAGTPGAEALRQVYGKTAGGVQTDLEQYLRGTTFSAVLFNITLQKGDEDPDVEPLPAAEYRLALAELLAASGKKVEAREGYESVAREFPQRWEPEAGLAELAWREGDFRSAANHFARADQLGSSNPRMYYDYASTLQQTGANSDDLVRVLKRAVTLNPEFQDAHRFLAVCLIQAGSFQEAIDHLLKVNSIKPDEAFAHYHALAYAEYRLGNGDAAKKALEIARKFARTPVETEQAANLLRALEQNAERPRVARVEVSAVQPANVAPQEPAGAKPRLVRRSAEEPSTQPQPAEPRPTPLAAVQGKLRQIDCLGTIVRLRLLANQKEVALVITDPKSVRVKGSATGTLDLTCGPQKMRGVILEYEDRRDPRLGTIGVIRSIEFQ